jgi:uncharacterized SAM-binding protein YcdF (DUF218 family)
MLLLYLKTILRQLLLPPAGPLLLAIAGLLLLPRRPRVARCLLWIGLASLWLLATPVVAGAITRLAQHFPALQLDHLDGAQAIVILGGGDQRAWAPEYGGPAASAGLLEKLSYGAYLARRTGLPILVTGYGIEAQAMRATLQRNFDITPRWIDAQAFDTFENARNAAAMLKRDGIERIILLTSATHMLRSLHEFTATGLRVMPAPVGTRVYQPPEYAWEFVPSANALWLSYEACYELLGEPVRWLLETLHVRRQSY